MSAASASGAGKLTTVLPKGKKTMSWPETVAGKIEEGVYKVRMIGRCKEDVCRDIEKTVEEIEDMEAEMDIGLELDEYCLDLEDMRKARQHYRALSLSDAEERSLVQIYDLAASAIADYEARVGPVREYQGPINMFNDTIPLELPRPLAEEKAFAYACQHKREDGAATSQ